MAWKGILPAVITPFGADGRIDFDAFSENLVRMIEAGNAGLVINAVTGEGLSMSADERLACVKCACEVAAGRVPVIATVGSVSDTDTIDDIQGAERAGAAGTMIIAPYFYRLSRKERIDYFVRMGSKSALPFIIYNTTYTSGQLEVDELEAIADATPRFVGLKEGNQLQASEVVRRLSPQVAVYTSRDTYIQELAAAGGSGAVTYSSNVVPQLPVELWRAHEAGENARARALQDALNPVAWALVVRSFPSAIKGVMNELGWRAGSVRPPLENATEEDMQRLRPILDELQLTSTQ
ncbi:dihydrodipicolinate synthase family protein [Caenimonas soli]|uniref:dihydrodipicolinate synthase family protein n=1 Tax=Caenimonas soli TaxID=2735555 RepID=UPI001F30B637|nr:dihydrodipicolinate synthase family protein [Caenimonas soli]